MTSFVIFHRSAEEIPQYNQKRDEWNKAEKVVQDTMEAKKVD